ncbi:MAG: response regulator [Bacteroidota bacterium]
MTKSNKTVHLLLADDDAVDRELFSEALKSTRVKYKLDEVSGGEEVFTHLGTSNDKPDLIVLDLNMPVKDGRETLKELKRIKISNAFPSSSYQHRILILMSCSHTTTVPVSSSPSLTPSTTWWKCWTCCCR